MIYIDKFCKREFGDNIRDRRVGSWDVRDVGKRIPFDEVSPVECVLFVDNSQTMFRKIREIRLSHFGDEDTSQGGINRLGEMTNQFDGDISRIRLDISII